MSTSKSPLVLPIVTIQPDFQTVISEVYEGLIPSEPIWVSCYKSGEESVHAKIEVTLDEVDRDKVIFRKGDGGTEVNKDGENYTITCPALSIPTTSILTPNRTFLHPNSTSQRPTTSAQRITAFDISPDGSQYATGYHDGSLILHPTHPAAGEAALKVPKAHLSTITSIRYFPSSKVLLTAGADFALTIRSTDSDTAKNPARVLRGHTRTITSIATVARGRNVISSAQDGSVRLWDVGSGEQIWVGHTTGSVGINAMVLTFGEFPDAPSGGTVITDAREVETNDKLVFCALSDGSFEIFSLATKGSLYRSPSSSSSLTAISYSPSHKLLSTGSSRGVINIYNAASLNDLSSPYISWSRNAASIEDIAFSLSPSSASVELTTATDDGLSYIATISHGSLAGVNVKAEIIGGDCEGVRAVRVGEGEIWTAGDDGAVRTYQVL